MYKIPARAPHIKISSPISAPSKMDELQKGIRASLSGVKLNKFALRLTAENLAHSDTLATTPGGEAYRAKVPIISSTLDPESGSMTVHVKKVIDDKRPLPLEHNPHHPGANAQGYVKKTNVNTMVERLHQSKYRQAFNANLQAYQVSLQVRRREIDSIGK